jgi:hypothetical protein
VSRRLLPLRDVPDDEAEDVRGLLREAGIEFHESRSTALGLFAGAIWITHDEQFDRAKRLFDEYQSKRAQSARAEHAEALRKGEVPGFMDQLRDDPVRVLLVLAGVAFFLGLSLLPFFLLRG